MTPASPSQWHISPSHRTSPRTANKESTTNRPTLCPNPPFPCSRRSHRQQGGRGMRRPWHPRAKKEDPTSPDPLPCCNTEMNVVYYDEIKIWYSCWHATDTPPCPLLTLETTPQCIYPFILTKKMYDLMKKYEPLTHAICCNAISN